MPHKQKKNTEEKVRIVRQYLQGEISITRAAELGDVDRDTIRKWISKPPGPFVTRCGRATKKRSLPFAG